jgi:hypothetical protein
MTVSGWRADWQQFVRLNRGASRRLLAGVMASPDADPAPFVIWTTALALTPLLLTTIRSTLRLSMTGPARGGDIFEFVQTFRVFDVFYALLLALLATAAIWDALLPDRADQEVMGTLPVRPMVMAAARLAAATRVMLVLAGVIAVPVALSFAAAAGMQAGFGGVGRSIVAHIVTITAAVLSLFFVLVTLRAAVALAGSEAVAERLTSLLQVAALLLFVDAFTFLPGVMMVAERTLRDGGPPPAWCAPAFWFAALYGWIAEGGPRTVDVTRALLAVAVPVPAAILLALLPAAHLARRAQQSLYRQRASLVTRVVRVLVAIRRPDSIVAGMTVFAAATLARSRRHALLLASYTGMAVAMAIIELLTAGFTDRFNLAAPRQDVLAVPLVVIFFAVFGFRAALAQPADPEANWIFRIAPPSVRDGRRAAQLLVTWLGLGPIMVATGAALLTLWSPVIALKVLAMDVAAALLLSELAFSRWTKIPAASLHAAATDSVKSTWPLVVLFLYLFAFRGADVEMFALRHGTGAWLLAAALTLTTVVVRLHSNRAAVTQPPTIDVAPEGLALLTLGDI